MYYVVLLVCLFSISAVAQKEWWLIDELNKRVSPCGRSILYSDGNYSPLDDNVVELLNQYLKYRKIKVYDLIRLLKKVDKLEGYEASDANAIHKWLMGWSQSSEWPELFEDWVRSTRNKTQIKMRITNDYS